MKSFQETGTSPMSSHTLDHAAYMKKEEVVIWGKILALDRLP